MSEDKPDYLKSLELWIKDLHIFDEGTDAWSSWEFRKPALPIERNPPERTGDPEQENDKCNWVWFPCYPGECANHTGRWLELGLECFRRWLVSRTLRPVPPEVPDWSWYVWAEEDPALLLLDPALKFVWYWFIYPHIRTRRAWLGEGTFDPPLDPPWGSRPLEHYDRETWPFEDLGFGEGGQSVSAGRIEYLRCMVDTVTLGPWDPEDPMGEAYVTGPFYWPITGTDGFGINAQTGEWEIPDLTQAELVKPNETAVADFMLPLKWCASNRERDTSPGAYLKNCIDTRGWISVPRLVFGDRPTDVFGNSPPQTWVGGAGGVGAPESAGVKFIEDAKIGDGIRTIRGSMLAQPSLLARHLNHIAQVADLERWVSYPIVSPNSWEGYIQPTGSYEMSQECWDGWPKGCGAGLHGCFREVWTGVMDSLVLDTRGDTCWNNTSFMEFGYKQGSGPWGVNLTTTYGGTYQRIRVSRGGSSVGLYQWWDDTTIIYEGQAWSDVGCWDGFFATCFATRRWFALEPAYIDPTVVASPSPYLGLSSEREWYLEVLVQCVAGYFYSCDWFGPVQSWTPPPDPGQAMPSPTFHVYARINPPKEEFEGSVWHDPYSPEGTPAYSLPAWTNGGQPIWWYNAPCPLGDEIGSGCPTLEWFNCQCEMTYPFTFEGSRSLIDRTFCIPIKLSKEMLQTLLEHPTWVQFCVEMPPMVVNAGNIPDPPYMWLLINQDVEPNTYQGTGWGSCYGADCRCFVTPRRLFCLPKGTYGLGRWRDPNLIPE